MEVLLLPKLKGIVFFCCHVALMSLFHLRNNFKQPKKRYLRVWVGPPRTWEAEEGLQGKEEREYRRRRRGRREGRSCEERSARDGEGMGNKDMGRRRGITGEGVEGVQAKKKRKRGREGM